MLSRPVVSYSGCGANSPKPMASGSEVGWLASAAATNCPAHTPPYLLSARNWVPNLEWMEEV
ncbi:MAG TPA: hypothetical protein VE687_09615, partial [Stellaceae bacterium]|nr:hypothetical protein [Stellaceae bacterium]